MHSTLAAQTEYILLNPGTTLQEVEQVCKKAIEGNIAAICVPPLLVEKAKKITEGSGVKIATVIGYPYGYSVIEAKLAEIIMAMVDGVDELDVVINLTALKNNDWQYLATELNTILPVIRKKQKTVKIVVDTALLTNDEIIKCCDLYGISGVDYLSLSTGMEIGSNPGDKLGLVRKHLADSVGIKLTGIFKDGEEANSLVEAGAGRIGRLI
jgi:deoxyribose-phosphate aldolase